MRIISFLKKRKTYYIIRDLILYNSKEKKNSFIYIYICKKILQNNFDFDFYEPNKLYSFTF